MYPEAEIPALLATSLKDEMRESAPSALPLLGSPPTCLLTWIASAPLVSTRSTSSGRLLRPRYDTNVGPEIRGPRASRRRCVVARSSPRGRLGPTSLVSEYGSGRWPPVVHQPCFARGLLPSRRRSLGAPRRRRLRSVRRPDHQVATSTCVDPRISVRARRSRALRVEEILERRQRRSDSTTRAGRAGRVARPMPGYLLLLFDTRARRLRDRGHSPEARLRPGRALLAGEGPGPSSISAGDSRRRLGFRPHGRDPLSGDRVRAPTPLPDSPAHARGIGSRGARAGGRGDDQSTTSSSDTSRPDERRDPNHDRLLLLTGWRVRRDLGARVRLHADALTTDLPSRRFHATSCRTVLIMCHRHARVGPVRAADRLTGILPSAARLASLWFLAPLAVRAPLIGGPLVPAALTPSRSTASGSAPRRAPDPPT